MIRPYSRAFTMITASIYFMILAGCGGGDSGPTSPTPPDPTPPTPPPAPVATSITVAPSSHTLASIGATVQLTATVRDQNNNTMTGQAVTWTSSVTAVATVSGNGLVTAVSNGTTQITARSGNASGTANITVAEPVPTRIAVTPSSHTLETIGATVQLTATVRDQRNNVMSGQTITWSSGDAAVATVSGTGLVSAVGNGMAEITARSGNLSANATITVASPVATSISIEPSSHTLAMTGATVQLTATVRDQHENVMSDVTVTWSSGDESVATVDANGLVTAVGNGMAEITAQAGDVMGTASITVSLPVATSISVEPSSLTLAMTGATVQLTATVRDQNENVMSDV
ncbi:MAG: Ig domain-containing protein, partial [Gemmatimonadetes bacterium]|nr:Ig domain-containing protein [Gemmatimonadota bacterium]